MKTCQDCEHLITEAFIRGRRGTEVRDALDCRYGNYIEHIGMKINGRMPAKPEWCPKEKNA